MADTYNARIDQGSVFDLSLTYQDDNGTPIDLTGYSARMQARTNYDAATTILDLSSATSAIVLGGAAGTIGIHLTATETSALAAGRYRYDLELLPAGDNAQAIRLLEGVITVTREVTR